MSISDIYIIAGVLGLAWATTMLVAILNIWKLLERLVELKEGSPKKK